MDAWDFWIDRGGTFTDIVARDPAGELMTSKLLSENPEVYSDAALHGIRQFLGLDAPAPIPVPTRANIRGKSAFTWRLRTAREYRPPADQYAAAEHR